jgi:hypothetical protein
MNTGVTRWINSLKNVRLGLSNLNDPQAYNYISSLDEVINFLEEYYKKEKVYKGESPTEKAKIMDSISERQSSKKKEMIQEIPNCAIGRHWVRRPKNNGEPGFCRNNPKRRK